MPIPSDIADLRDLSETGAMLEGVLHDWVYEISQLSVPDIPTLAEAIDFFARLTAVRKTLIKLSRLEPPRTNASPAPSPAIPKPSANSNAAPDPATAVLNETTQLPEPQLDPLPSIPCVPLDRLRPELDQLTSDFNHLCPQLFPNDAPVSENNQSDAPDAPDDPEDLDDPEDSEDSHSSDDSHSSHASRKGFTAHTYSPADHPFPYDPRCVALNIHPIIGDTSKFPNRHLYFDRSQYGDFHKSILQPWHRKKIPKRYG